jgi:phospholipid-binding lipoprotein MlaA
MKNSSRLNLRAAGLSVAALLSIAGCATAPTDPDELAEYREINDPFEPTNRAVFEINLYLDRLILRPVAWTYREIVPDPTREVVTNFLNNLRSPYTFANDLLQGEVDRAGVTVARFLINSTIGIAGMADVAGNIFGLDYHAEDIGQTFAVWGAGSGPYLMLPILGPSNPRDAAGLGIEYFVEPVNWFLRENGASEWVLVRTGANAVDQRHQLLDTLDALERTSLDYYAQIRSISRQRRLDEIQNRASGSNSAPQPLGDGGGAPEKQAARSGG